MARSTACSGATINYDKLGQTWTNPPLEKTMTNIDSLQKTYTQASQRIPTNKTVYVCTGSLLPHFLSLE